MLKLLKTAASYQLPVQLLDEMMGEAVLSDSQEAVTIIKEILTDQHHTVSDEFVLTAKNRGLVKIIKLLDPEYQDTTEHQKQSLKQSVPDKTASIQGKIISLVYLNRFLMMDVQI